MTPHSCWPNDRSDQLQSLLDQRWRGIYIAEFEQRQLKTVCNEIDPDFIARHAPPTTATPARSRAVITLTAVRLSRLRPSASADTASTPRVDSPRTCISATKASSFSAPRTTSRMGARNGSVRSAVWARCTRWPARPCRRDPFDSHCGLRCRSWRRKRNKSRPRASLASLPTLLR